MVPEAGIAPASPPLQGGANLSQLLGERFKEEAVAPPEQHHCRFLVQERYIRHRSALGLSIHDHPMPERERNGCMVAVSHRAAHVDAGIATHYPPAPLRGFR